MDIRYHRRALNRRAPEPVYLSDSEDFLVEGEVSSSEEQRDHRLQQAISYITSEGRSDTLDLYADRIQKIDNELLQRYAGEGYLFDPKLYQQLKTMVRRVQNSLRRIVGGGMEMLEGGADSGEVAQGALSRELLDFSEDESPYDSAKRAGVGKARSKSTIRLPPVHNPQSHHQRQTSNRSAAQSGKTDVPREVEWRYGGPKNEKEVYYKNSPAMLPFGETLYMQVWESLKMDSDLQASANRRLGDPPVTTNVPYESVADFVPTGKSNNHYSSGSRFTLPEGDLEDTKWLESKGGSLLKKVVANFNLGGNNPVQADKDYAPRIWLPKIISPVFSITDRACSAPASSARSSWSSKGNVASKYNLGTSLAGTPSSYSSLLSRHADHNAGTSDPFFGPAISYKAIRSPHSTAKAPIRVPEQPSASPSAKKPVRVVLNHKVFQSRSTLASTEKDTVRPASSRSVTNHAELSFPSSHHAQKTAPSKHPTPAALAPKPIIRKMKYIAPEPAVRRGPERPPGPNTIPVIATKMVPTKAPGGTKRKLSVGSQRFKPEKQLSSSSRRKVSFEELESDDDEVFSDFLMAKHKRVRKGDGKDVEVEPEGPLFLSSPSYTRSGRTFLPGL